MSDDLPEDDTRPMPSRFRLGCPYCGLIGIGTEHEEVCPENPARKMSHAELIAMCEEHQRQLAERDAEIEKLKFQLEHVTKTAMQRYHALQKCEHCEYDLEEIEKLRQWQRKARTKITWLPNIMPGWIQTQGVVVAEDAQTFIISYFDELLSEVEGD